MTEGKDLVVLYIRLSSADEDRGEKGESNSVVNQKLLLHQFLDKHPDLAHYPRFIGVDDGFSGTNGNRPMLQKVLAMAENGQVKAIVVKDTSRFFRNYYETSKYLDINFPTWNVRFISVLDDYDSDDYKGTTAGIEQAMRSIINSYYPKMISQSTIAAQTNLMKQGKFVGSQAPFGYKKHPTERHKLVIDEESAKIVRWIFEMALEGKTVSEIAVTLNSKEIETPWRYFARKFPDNKRFANTDMDSIWGLSTIIRILTRYTYTGALVSRKRKVAYVGSRTTIPCEPIVVEGTHEGIVTGEEFQLAQTVIKNNKKSKVGQPREYLLRNLVRCGECKRMTERIVRKNTSAVFRCKQTQLNSNCNCPKELKFPEDKLEEMVLQCIREHLLEQDVSEKAKDSFSYSKKTDSKGKRVIENEIKLLRVKIQDLKRKKRADYVAFSTDKLSKSDFLELKTQKDDEISLLEKKIHSMEEELTETLVLEKPPTKNLFNLDVEHLTAEVAQRYIKAVYICDLDKIEIEFLK